MVIRNDYNESYDQQQYSASKTDDLYIPQSVRSAYSQEDQAMINPLCKKMIVYIETYSMLYAQY